MDHVKVRLGSYCRILTQPDNLLGSPTKEGFKESCRPVQKDQIPGAGDTLTRTQFPSLVVQTIRGENGVEGANAAMRKGTIDQSPNPFDLRQLEAAVDRVIEPTSLPR